MTQHLRPNRELILGRAIVAGAVGLIPVPYLDDLLATRVRRTLVRRLAEIRGLDLDDEAVQVLAAPTGSRILGAATVGTLALGPTRRLFRTLSFSFNVLRRVDEAVDTFLVTTLFDHYAAKHHVGLGLDGEGAERLRRVIDKSVGQVRGDALRGAFKRALRSSAAFLLAAPRGAIALLSRKKKVDAAAANEDAQVEAEVNEAAHSPMVRRALERVEAEMVALEKSHLEGLLERFDEHWQRVKEARAS
jgi:hypothetical protein